MAAALFDVRVKRMYEKKLCPDRGRRRLVSIVMAQRAASKKSRGTATAQPPKESFWEGTAVFRDFRES